MIARSGACGALLAAVAILGGCAGEVESRSTSVHREAPDESGRPDVVSSVTRSCAAKFPGTSWPVVPSYASDVAAADFNGDGHVNLVEVGRTGAVILLGERGGRFEAAQVVASAPDWVRVHAGDFDADGKQDLMVLRVGDSSATPVGLLRGHGDGTFDPPVYFAGPVGSDVAVVADFNGDGRQDVALGGAGVAVLLGNILGTFDEPFYLADTSYPGLTTGLQIAAADFDGDGRLDLALATSYGSAVVALGYGDGTFQLPSQGISNSPDDLLVAGDLNGDGAPDVLEQTTTSGYPQLVVALNNRDGTFTEEAPQPFQTPLGLAESLVDVDGDGRLDLVVGNTIRFGHGDGTFGKFVRLVGEAAVAAVVDDLDGDGVLDVALATSNDYLGVLLGKGDRTFGALPQDASIGGKASALVVADFNGDGRSDVAVARSPAASVDVLLSAPDGALRAPKHFPVNAAAQALAAGDLDGDGVADLVSGSPSSPYLSVLLAKGAGGFYGAADVDAGPGPSALAITDLDGDGHANLVVATNASLVRVLLGVGDGTFAAPVSYQLLDPYGQAVVVGDFNGDGKPDVAIALGGSRPATLDVVLGNGDGTLGASTRFTLHSQATVTQGLAVGDFNRDGKLDLVGAWAAAQVGDPVVGILLGRGNGDFDVEPVDMSHVAAAGLATADFDRDGVLDLATTITLSVSAGRPETVSLLAGAGNGTFSLKGVYPTIPTGAGVLATGDVNADGWPDLIGASTSGDGVTVLLGGQCE